MHDAILHLRENIARVRSLGGLYQAMHRLMTPAVDCTDILRAQIVLAVSALDYYVHEITRLGMLEVYSGIRPQTTAFLRFQVSIEAAIVGITNTGQSAWFDGEIRDRHGYLAFQQPDKIADAVRLFSSSELWPSVAIVLGLPVDDVKTQLRLIVERRNKIAHEADLDPSYPSTLWPISAADASNTVDFVERVCEAIHSSVV